MKISTSNQRKIEEIKSIINNIEVVKGVDLKEVNGTMDEVILHKAKDAGTGFIVEDTILKIDGVEVIDIRWNQEDKLKDTKKVEWIVSLGYNNGTHIEVFRGIINGIIVEPNCEGYGFDPYILPDGSDITVAELDKLGRKNDFSARKFALLNLKNNKPEFITKISDIIEWTGDYQND